MIKWTLEVVVLTTIVVLTTCSMVSEHDWTNKFDPFLLQDKLDEDFPFLQPFSKGFDTEEYPPCEIPENSTRSSRLNINIKLKKCNYRGGYYPDIIYKWVTGHGCFFYAQPANCDTTNKARIGTCIYNETSYAPCFFIPVFNETISLCYPIDPDIPEVMREIDRTMANKQAVEKWKRCTNAAMECCNEAPEEASDPKTCPTIWDAWSCWPSGKAGQNSTQVCPEFAYSNQGPVCHHYSNKFCNGSNGDAVWVSQSDYSTCTVTPRLLLRNEIHVALLAVSVAICTPAVIVMLAYKRLRTPSLAMHRNLLIFIIIRNILIIIIKTVIIENELTTSEGETLMGKNSFWCKFLTVLEKFASSSTFTCMLVDGIFLHRRIANVFKKALNLILIYSVATAITILPIIVWIALMAVYNDSNCWVVYEIAGIQWVLDVPRISILFVNTVLLVDILRVILTKLNSQDNVNQLSTAKATLFLMPLFGVQFLLTAWRPKTISCPWEQIYYIFTYVMDSLQGIMVAVLYCYWNKEVHNLIKATYKKTENVVTTRFTKHVERRRATQANISNRRDTYSTMVDNDDLPPSIYITDTSNNNRPVSPDLNCKDTPAAEIFGSSFYSASSDGLISMDFEHDSNQGYETNNFEIDAMSGYGHYEDLWVKHQPEKDQKDSMKDKSENSDTKTNQQTYC